jgi:hypothetical protein
VHGAAAAAESLSGQKTEDKRQKASKREAREAEEIGSQMPGVSGERYCPYTGLLFCIHSSLKSRCLSLFFSFSVHN